MRTIATVLLLLLLARAGRAETVPPSPQQRYEREKKSPALALTLEALCPIAGAGAIYAGRDGDKAAFLAVLSGVAAGAGTGSGFWLIHLDSGHAAGVSRVAVDVEQGAAISLLVTAAIVYLIARASGLGLASDATESFNFDLQRQLGLSPDRTGMAFLPPPRVPSLRLRF